MSSISFLSPARVMRLDSCSLEVVVLEQLFIGEVAVLSLDRVKLVAECEVILVSLLDFKDLGLELGD